MVIVKLTYDEISSLILNKAKYFGDSGISFVPERVIIIPYVWIEANESQQSFVLLQNTKNGEKNIISDFGGEFSFSSLDEYISSSLIEKTFGTLTIPNDHIRKNTSFFASIDNDYKNEVFLVPNTPIVCLVNLGTSTKLSLNGIIVNFIENYKYKLRTDPKSSNFLTNLVYMSQLDFYYLIRGTTFHIYDDESGEEYEMEVKDGITFDDDLINLYNAKPTDIAVTVIYNPEANFPFRVYNFSQIITSLQKTMLPLMNDETLDLFPKA